MLNGTLLPVAAERGADEREERRVLRNRQNLAVAERPTARREGVRDQNDHPQERLRHDSRPPTGRGDRLPAHDFICAPMAAETSLIDGAPAVRRTNRDDEQIEASERRMPKSVRALRNGGARGRMEGQRELLDVLRGRTFDDL